MGSPAGVRDSGVRLEALGHVVFALLDEFLQFGYLANFLEGQDFILLVAIDGHTSGIIATVFQSGES